MASCQPQGTASPSIINLITAEQLRIEINTHFEHLIQSLKDRESHLLAQLNEIISTYEANSRKLQFKLEELTQLFNLNKKNVKVSELHHLQGNILKEIDRELESTSKQLNALPSPEFIWNDTLLNQILTHGSIEFTSKAKLNPIHYNQKLSALVSVSKKGSGFGELNDPWGLDINRDSGDIYITDQLNNRVQVFDSECRFKSTFNSTDVQQPLGIAVHNGKVFVCEATTENILVFDLEGKLLNRFGNTVGFNSTSYGIAIHESTGNIYVCNFKNNQIQIYNENMEAVNSLTGFKNPCYILLTDTHIIILDKGNPCLHWYNYDLDLVRSFITRGPELQVENVAAFCLDSNENILMTDNYSIKIFTQQGELIHQIVDDVVFPNGIRIDSKNRIIIVSYRKEKNLQMF